MLWRENLLNLKHFLETTDMQSNYFGLLTLWPRRNNILLRAELVIHPWPLTSLNLHTKRHYYCYFCHKWLRRKSESLCSILIVFSAIFEQCQSKDVTSHSKMVRCQSVKTSVFNHIYMYGRKISLFAFYYYYFTCKCMHLLMFSTLLSMFKMSDTSWHLALPNQCTFCHLPHLNILIMQKSIDKLWVGSMNKIM